MSTVEYSSITGTLDNWSVETYGTNQYIIWGEISGDVRERFEDGKVIHTSCIYTSNHPLESLVEGSVVHTLNSTYVLARPMEQILREALQEQGDG